MRIEDGVRLEHAVHDAATAGMRSVLNERTTDDLLEFIKFIRLTSYGEESVREMMSWEAKAIIHERTGEWPPRYYT